MPCTAARFGDIGLVGACGSSGINDLGNHTFRLFLRATVVEGDLRPFSGKAERYLAAHVAGATRHQCDTIGQLHVHDGFLPALIGDRSYGMPGDMKTEIAPYGAGPAILTIVKTLPMKEQS